MRPVRAKPADRRTAEPEKVPETGKLDGSSRGRIAIWSAVGVLLFFGAVVIVLIVEAHSASSSTWERLVYVYAGVEAVVFAAAGALFGSEVQRGRAIAAESRAGDEAVKTDELREELSRTAIEAQKGESLREAILSEAAPLLEAREESAAGARAGLGTERVGSGAPRESRPGGPAAVDQRIQRLADFARRLYGQQ